MKKGLILIVLVLLLSITAVTAATNSVLFPFGNTGLDARVSIVRYNPIPVAPGEYFDVWISVESQPKYLDSIINYDDLHDVELELMEEYPFILDPSESPIRFFGTLEQGERAQAKYRIRVADDAASGDHEIRFVFRASGYESGTETPPLEINVQAQDTTMSVVDIQTHPDLIIPGKPANLSITVRNDALRSFKNINAMIDIDAATIPIVPYKSSKEQTLRTLSQGTEYTFSYSIIAEEDANAGVYKIPFVMTYSDSNNSIITKQDTFGILIGGEGDLEYNLEEFDTFQQGSEGQVVVSVSNIGPSELKFMTIELLPSDDYVNLGKNKEYLGNLDSDDFETSVYDISAIAKDDFPLEFRVVYKDAYNEEHTETFELNLPVYSKDEVRSYGLDGKTSGFVTMLIYLVIILFIYFGFKGWRAEKKLDRAVLYAVAQLIKLPFRIILFFRPSNLRTFPAKIREFFKDL